MGAFRPGIKEACMNAILEKPPLAVGGHAHPGRLYCFGRDRPTRCGTTGRARGLEGRPSRIRGPCNCGPIAASATITFFGIRRASVAAELLTSDQVADLEGGMAHVDVARRKNGQVGMQQLAYLVALADWGDARPLRTFADWLRFRGRCCRMSPEHPPDQGGSSPIVPSVGLGRARFGFGMAVFGVGAAIKKSLWGRILFPERDVSVCTLRAACPATPRRSWLVTKRNGCKERCARRRSPPVRRGDTEGARNRCNSGRRSRDRSFAKALRSGIRLSALRGRGFVGARCRDAHCPQLLGHDPQACAVLEPVRRKETRHAPIGFRLQSGIDRRAGRRPLLVRGDGRTRPGRHLLPV